LNYEHWRGFAMIDVPTFTKIISKLGFKLSLNRLLSDIKQSF
jgi:hypothetical protein